MWTVLNGNSPSYQDSGYNNFHKDNSVKIGQLFGLTGNIVGDYHRTTAIGGSDRLTRCSSESGVQDGVADDIKGLIEFTRGTDYFDYDADCNLTEIRKNPLGDIYHSEMVVVGAPSAETSFVSSNQESYWLSLIHI